MSPTEQHQRDRIIRAAVDVAANHTYEGATVANITAGAGVSRGTFYKLFDNAAAVLEAAFAWVVEDASRQVVSAAAIADGAQAEAELSIMQLAVYGLEHPTRARFVLIEGPGACPWLYEALMLGTAERMPLPTTLGHMVVGGVSGILVAALRSGEPLDPHELATFAGRYFREPIPAFA